jgi:hypothetical protein
MAGKEDDSPNDEGVVGDDAHVEQSISALDQAVKTFSITAPEMFRSKMVGSHVTIDQKLHKKIPAHLAWIRKEGVHITLSPRGERLRMGRYVLVQPSACFIDYKLPGGRERHVSDYPLSKVIVLERQGDPVGYYVLFL